MIAREIAIFILIFAGLTGMVASLGIFDFELNTKEYNVNTSQIEGIIAVDETGHISDEQGFAEENEGLFVTVKRIAGVIFDTFKIVLDLGGFFQEHIPNQVGTELRIIIDAVVWMILGWNAVQIYKRIGTKGMD